MSRRKREAEPFRPSSGMLSIYDGQTCCGFFLNRGRDGVEAYDATGNSLGLFPTQDAAAAALYSREAS
jgi:hypothetical protein